MAKGEITAALQGILRQNINAGIPGLSAAIASSQGLIWRSTAGQIDLEAGLPVDTSHLFGIGSITKVFVTVVILQLVDEQKLKLGDTIEELLPLHVYQGIEHAPTATIAGLLSHSAGVESWEDDPIWIINARGKQLDPGKIWEKSETLDYIRRPNPSGPKPGEYSYSNTNFTLLGLVIEKITRNPAQSEIRRRILEPLGMNHTYLEGFETARPHTSPRRYHWNTESFRKIAGICPSFTLPRENLIDATGSNMSVEWVAGGMLSSPSDLVTLALALRDGKLLSPSSLQVMKEWRPAQGSSEMGHGLFRFDGPNGAGKWLGHSGDVLGFTGTWSWKEQGDCAVCILANVGSMHAGRVPSRASDILGKSAFLQLASDLAGCE